MFPHRTGAYGAKASLQAFGLLLVCCLLTAEAPAAQAPSLDAVLARTVAYVADFIPRFANVVASERYEQRLTLVGGSRPVPLVRRLRSDLLLVRYPLGELDWMVFRDVVEVDGTPLGHAQDRLVTLFAESSAEAAHRAALIAGESARHHIPGASFAVTNPLLVLALMQEHYQPRLRFTLGGEPRSAGPGVRVVRFEEREVQDAPPGERGGRRETLPPLLGDVGRVRGTLWVEVRTGRILRTDARLGGTLDAATSITTFAHDERLGLTVPVEMQTRWPRSTNLAPVEGTATYGEFRRFAVHTEAEVVR